MKKIIKIFLLSLIVIFGSGCIKKNSEIKVKSKETGEIIVECSLEESLLDKFSKISPGYFIAGIDSSQKDFLFGVDYSFNLKFGYLEKFSYPVDFPIEFYLKMPGKIIKSNAQKIENNTAIWKFNRGEEIYNLYLKSRYIRWNLIAGISIFLIIFTILYIKRNL